MKKPIGILSIIMLFSCAPEKKEEIRTPEKKVEIRKIKVASKSNREIVKKNTLSYLNDIEEIQWFEVDDNDVYISFNPVPSDWNLVIRGADFRAHKAINFVIHVWELKNKRRGWKPSDGGYLDEVTARYGRVEP